MCNYKYALHHNHRSMGKKCPYTEFYDALEVDSITNAKSLRADLDLPLDSRGTCIFHSDELEWKRKNDFATRFSDLLHLLNARDDDYYDFAEFTFVAGSPGASKGAVRNVLSITDRILKKEAKFAGSSFVDHVEFTRVDFEKGANFEEANFENGLTMRNTSLRGTVLNKATIKKDAHFESVDFLNSYAIFSDMKFGGSVTVRNSKFDGITDFSGTLFKPESSVSGVIFDNVRFGDFTDFANATFDCQAAFKNVQFNSNAEFVDVDFCTIKASYRYRGFSVEFVEIEIGKDGSLIFKSTDPQNKTFTQDAKFSFKHQPEGVVIFENVHFNHICESSRKALLRLSKLGKVEIGPGCIKYRLQTPLRTIDVGESNQPLTLEIAQIFTNYFTARSGINLGIEVVEREGDRISFFYFTDEDLSEAEFVDMLKDAESSLWGMLSVNFDEHYLLTSGQTGDGSLERTEGSIISAVDGVSALLGTFFRVGVRIAFGRWSPRDTKSLLNVIGFDNQQTQLNAENLHRILLSKYTGRALLSMSASQNQDLALTSPAGYDRTAAQRDPANGQTDGVLGAGTAARTKILFLAANPPGSRSLLDLDEEINKIQSNLEHSRERDMIDLKQVWAVTADTLMQAILDETPRIVHFSGHGRRGGIVLQDEAGKPKVVTAESLSSLFELFKDCVECVVLNSCYSELQAKAIKLHIPHVVGMKSEIPDQAAIAFSTGFYKAVGAGKDIPFAFELGVVAIKLEGVSSGHLPVMF